MNPNMRAWWAKKQGLDGSLSKSKPAEILEKAGWARSVGGVNPYLTLFSRAGVSAQAAEKAALNLEIHELPAARGCTYVVPASDFALALKAGQGFGEESEIQIAIKYLGVTEKEIDKLVDGVLSALKSKPKDPRELKKDLGELVRNLGDAGKKRGVTTTLPLALGRLQSNGQIRRVPANGKLNEQRYAYATWSPSPLSKSKLSSDQAYQELARRYFRWIGPATLKEFQAFAGIGVQAAKDAVASLKLAPIEEGSNLLLLSEEMDAFRSFKAPKQPAYSLLSSIDGLFLLRRDVAALTDAADLKRKAFSDTGSQKELGGMQDLPSHPIVDRGRLIGLWEFEPSSGKIVHNCFVTADKQLKAEIARMEEFVRDQLGDARSFSLDSPESRAPRIAALRK